MVHRAIEQYRLPPAVAQAYGAPTLGRAFLDQEELPATGSLPAAIRSALRHSRSLVVVCSTATPESRWIAQEIELFSSFHSRDRIYAVLAEGASAASMPPALRTKLQVSESGQPEPIPTEPLAADMRADAMGRFNQEKLRVIAGIAGCSYDDLRQREATRKKKHMAIIAAAAIALAAIIGSLAFFAGQQHDAALEQESRQLAVTSQQLFAQGDRYGAIETALEALPASSSDTSRPLVPEAQEALEAALEMHESTNAWRSSYSITTEHGMGFFDGVSAIFPDGTDSIDNSAIVLCDAGGYFAVNDTAGSINLYDLETGKHRASCALPEFMAAGENDEPLLLLAPFEDRIVVSDPPHNAFACFDAQSGEPIWSGTGIGIGTMACLADGATILGAQFAPEGGFTVEATDVRTGSTSRFADALGSSTLQVEGGVQSAASDDGRRFLIATNGKLVCVDRETGSTTETALAHPDTSALACYGDITLAGTVKPVDGTTYEYAYAIEAFDANLHKLWETRGTIAPENLQNTDSSAIVLGWPAFHDRTLSGNAAVASVGRTVYAFDLETGKVAYEHGFASSVLAVRPWNAPDDGADRLFVACADGSITSENPEDPTHNIEGILFRLQIGEAIRWSSIGYHDGLFTWLSASATADNRLIAYRTDLTCGSEPDHEYSLDELIAYAKEVLEEGR